MSALTSVAPSKTGTRPSRSSRKTPSVARREFKLAVKATTPSSLIATRLARRLKVPSRGAGNGSPVRATSVVTPPLTVSTALVPPRKIALSPPALGAERSEEHTSELQSLAYLVCRLLLEKKKKN